MARRARMSTLSMSPEEFEGLVRQAVDGLPDQYRRLLKNVAVVVEAEPSREVLDEMDMESEDDLLGLYSGTARDAESFFDPGGHLPAKISIYRGPILRLCRTPEHHLHLERRREHRQYFLLRRGQLQNTPNRRAREKRHSPHALLFHSAMRPLALAKSGRRPSTLVQLFGLFPVRPHKFEIALDMEDARPTERPPGCR